MNRVVEFLERPEYRVFIMSVLAGITWFCWAYWANRHYPEQALWSAFSQAGLNIMTTFLGSSALEILFVRIGHTKVGRLMSVLIVSSVSLATMVIVHIFVGTPNLLLTVLPVYGVAVLYCFSYVQGLHKIKITYGDPQIAVR